MAVWAASFFNVPEAAEVVFIAQDKPTDIYLDHLIRETMRVLDPLVKNAIAANRKIEFTTESGLRRVVKLIINAAGATATLDFSLGLPAISTELTVSAAPELVGQQHDEGHAQPQADAAEGHHGGHAR